MKKKKLGLFVIGLVFICIVVSITILNKRPEQGENYIKGQETREMNDIESKISEIKEEERNLAISNEDLDPFSLLGDFVFYGDSRVLTCSTLYFLWLY